jgi:hypothetical protein
MTTGELFALTFARQPLPSGRSRQTACLRRFGVGRGGLEPPTLGLRVPCSTS